MPDLDEIRGVGLYGQVLQRDMQDFQVRGLLAVRFAACAQASLRQLESSRILRDMTDDERAIVAAGLRRLEGAVAGSVVADDDSVGDWGADSLDAVLAPMVTEFVQDRQEFRRIVDSEFLTLMLPEATRMRRILRDIGNALVLVGIEQGECLRNARQEAMELVNGQQDHPRPLPWFLLGWLSLSGAGCADAISHFATGVASLDRRSDFLAYLMHRFLAISLDLHGRHSEAHETVKTALAIRTDLGVLIEAARYAARCGRTGEAGNYVREAVALDPLAILLVMAEPEMARLDGAITPCYVSAVGAARILLDKGIESWEAALQLVRQAEQAVGESLEMPAHLTKGIRDLTEQAEKADLLEMFGLVGAASASCEEVLAVAAKRLNTVNLNRATEVNEVKRHIEHADRLRARKREIAFRVQQDGLAQAHASNRTLVFSGDHAEFGIGLAISATIWAVVIITVAVGISNMAGDSFQLQSPLGLLAATLAGAPILVVAGKLFGHSLGANSASTEFERFAAKAKADYEKALEVIDAEHEAALEALEVQLAALEQRLSAAGEAMTALGPSIKTLHSDEALAA